MIASALYVTTSIIVLQRPQRIATGRSLSARDIAFALAVGLGAGIVITLVFQDLFLVRLPTASTDLCLRLEGIGTKP